MAGSSSRSRVLEEYRRYLAGASRCLENVPAYKRISPARGYHVDSHFKAPYSRDYSSKCTPAPVIFFPLGEGYCCPMAAIVRDRCKALTWRYFSWGVFSRKLGFLGGWRWWLGIDFWGRDVEMECLGSDYFWRQKKPLKRKFRFFFCYLEYWFKMYRKYWCGDVVMMRSMLTVLWYVTVV